MTEQDDITDMKKCRTGRRWMAGLLLGLGIREAGNILIPDTNNEWKIMDTRR